MTGTEEEAKRKLREIESKNVAYYSVLLQAWINTRMERDKTLVTLSAAGIGLLTSILTVVGVRKPWELFLYVGAVGGFGTVIGSALVIYQLNSEHLGQAIHGSSERDPRLEKYDKRSSWAFLFGVVCLAAIGVVAALIQLENIGGSKMAEGNHSNTNQPGAASVQKTVDSVCGIEKLEPSGMCTKSLNGITSLNPQQNIQTSSPVSQSGQSAASESSASVSATVQPAMTPIPNIFVQIFLIETPLIA